VTTQFLGGTAALTGRSLRHITRSPDTIITTTIMPIAFLLLFVYVFGGAINTGSDSYVNYLLPGILLITIASGISYTAFRLFLDMKSGIFERFQSLPIARSSVLWAHVLTSLVANLISVVVVVLVALLIGFHSGAGVLADSVALTGDASRVITIADENAAQFGVRFTGADPSDRVPEARAELAGLAAAGQLSVPIWRTYPLARAALAHADLEAGRNHGKIILRP